MNILFDSMGAQVQVQYETSNRLTTLFDALTSAGNTLSFTDYTQSISSQLDGADVLVILTHQWADAPGDPPAIPQGTSFAIPDVDAITTWVQGGGGLLLVSNHGGFNGTPAYWPIYDTPLAGALGVTIVPAAFTYSNELQNPLVMTPASTAPAAVVAGVGIRGSPEMPAPTTLRRERSPTAATKRSCSTASATSAAEGSRYRTRRRDRPRRGHGDANGHPQGTFGSRPGPPAA